MTASDVGQGAPAARPLRHLLSLVSFRRFLLAQTLSALVSLRRPIRAA